MYDAICDAAQEDIADSRFAITNYNQGSPIGLGDLEELMCRRACRTWPKLSVRLQPRRA